MATIVYAEPGCGRCADLVAASLLTGDNRFYDQLVEHQIDHKKGPSIWDRIVYVPHGKKV